MNNLELLTDFYELTMMQGYYYNDPDKRAVFDYFIRKNPFESGYTVFAGLDPLLDMLENLHFQEESIEYLRSTEMFKPEFLDYLKTFRFNCDIISVKEGEIIFPNEPVIRVSGPVIEAQLIESMLLNTINFQSLIATKASRIINSAGDKAVLEFGLRRAQGVNGAVAGTRASFIGGCASTSNVLAGKTFNIPVSGTMAHSWVMSFESELAAFEKYAEIFPDNCILLVDTYDTLDTGVPNAIKVFKKLQHKGSKKLGIRLDSGNFEELSKKARKMLDDNDLQEVKIFVSSELDEVIIDELLNKDCPIDAFGVGTKLITANPDASLSGVYKLTARYDRETGEEIPVIKLSDTLEKRTNPGTKNVLRFYNSEEIMEADLIYLENEEKELTGRIEDGDEIKINHQYNQDSNYWVEEYQLAEKLLKPVMKNGEVINRESNLESIKKYRQEQINKVHEKVRRFVNPHEYLVGLSENLHDLKNKMIQNQNNK